MNKNLIKIVVPVLVIVIIAIMILFLFKNKNKESTTFTGDGIFSSETKSLFQKAESLEKQGELIVAKNIYQQLLYDHPDPKSFKNIQDKISSINIKILFSSTPTPDSQVYKVVSGDSLDKIAKKFNTPIELIKKANNLNKDLIRVGMELKVQTNKFSIVVDKSQNTLTLFSQDEVFKVYNVSTGANNSTPVGTFKVINKLKNPPWYSAKGVIPPDSSENLLGTRWLGIDKPGYGIHGTVDPDSIGSQCTEGCVRMYNTDVEELYAIVPRNTEVTILN